MLFPGYGAWNNRPTDVKEVMVFPESVARVSVKEITINYLLGADYVVQNSELINLLPVGDFLSLFVVFIQRNGQ